MTDGVEAAGESRLRFNDGKAGDAMRTIGEVAQALDIKQHVLRYWEQQFPMLRPLKRSGGRRYYRSEDVALVERIDRLINREGYTLKGARQLIEKGEAPAGAPSAGLTASTTTSTAAVSQADSPSQQDIVAMLRTIRAKLASALEA